MKKIFSIVVVALMVTALVLTGCQKKEAAPAAAAPAASSSSAAAFIGIAMPETHVLRWIKDGNELKADFEKLGYTAEAQWANADQSIQNGQINAFLTQGAKGLVIGCVSDGVTSVVADAARDNVVVVAYDRIIPNTTDYKYFLTFNNFKVGVLEAEGIVEGAKLNEGTAANPKYITLFAGSPTDGNSFFFFDGAMSVLNPLIEKGGVKVIGPYPKTSKDTNAFQQIATENWTASIAKTRMENLLANDAREVVLDAVLSPNDTLARAIVEACKADAKYTSKLPAVSGQDCEAASVAAIRDGTGQYSTVFKNTQKLAEAAAMLVDQELKGQAINIPGAEIATGDLKEIGNTGTGYVTTYLLDPVKITKANYKVPIDAGFFNEEETKTYGF
ncbi:MAG: sugar-binding protein [Spirochaetaceae bacterium]|jgi:putative multiple sugar transport system substrate-binding protein|nr:sugar-binding protein [Spirochaetaceae bacterium]